MASLKPSDSRRSASTIPFHRLQRSHLHGHTAAVGRSHAPQLRRPSARAHSGHHLHQRCGFFPAGRSLSASPTTFLGTYLFYEGGNLLLILLMFLWDWKRNRIMKQFLWAAFLVTAVGLTATGLYFNATWQSISRSWLEAGRGTCYKARCPIRTGPRRRVFVAGV